MDELAGKVAVITGGVSGIGLGIAKAFAGAGAKIVLGYRREDHLADAKAWFDARPGCVLFPVRLDVTDRENWATAMDAAEAALGRIDILVNNAGISFPGRIDQASQDDWEWIMKVNFWGVVYGIQECLPRIRRHGAGGHILNVSSMAAYVAGAEIGLYATSKFAVRGLTESLRPALAGEGIGVSELAPGLTRSNIHHAAENRPAEFADTRFAPNPDQTRLFGELMSKGMDPEEVGRRTLQGMIENRPIIFSHPESRDEVREICEQIVAAFPTDIPPPERLAIEEHRRANKAGGGGLLHRD
ncbi:MAG: short-chain dehydrogenase/reductase [Sphingomonas bacterium]|nr:short-chain dehydrogenase/reductase [Sphingomonas bacterium]